MEIRRNTVLISPLSCLRQRWFLKLEVRFLKKTYCYWGSFSFSRRLPNLSKLSHDTSMLSKHWLVSSLYDVEDPLQRLILQAVPLTRINAIEHVNRIHQNSTESSIVKPRNFSIVTISPVIPIRAPLLNGAKVILSIRFGNFFSSIKSPIFIWLSQSKPAEP